MTSKSPVVQGEHSKSRMKAQHTPGPWYAERALAGGDYAISDQHKNILAECYEDIRRANEHAAAACAANAAYIVKSANAYPKLIDTLTQAKLQIAYMQSKFTKTGTGNAVIADIDNLLRELGEPE